MPILKIIIFIIGLFLIRYVGGIPEDSRNFFITQFIFFAPFLIDFYKNLAAKSLFIKVAVIIGLVAGVAMILVNLLGIIGVVIMQTDGKTIELMFNEAYHMGNKTIEASVFMNVGTIVYLYVFFATISFEGWKDTGSNKTREKEVVPDATT